jgi:branched-chain amino acid transport system permease protein
LFIGIVLYLFFGFTVPGRAFRASAINVLGATLRGIRTDRMGVFAFMLASSIGGLAGAVLAPMMCTSYDMGLGISIKGFFAGIIGGLNRIEGIIAGGLALGILENYGAGLIHSGFKDAIPLFIFLVILYFRRGGLLGGEESGRI